MARRSSFVAAIVRAQGEAQRRHVAQRRAESQAARDAERAQKAYARAQKESERERARLYAESRSAEVALKNQQLEEQTSDLDELLAHSLGVANYFDLDKLKQELVLPTFDARGLDLAEHRPTLVHICRKPH